MLQLIGNKIIQIDEIDSTNVEIVRLFNSKKISNGNILISKYQSEGKGTSNKHWESKYGDNLLFSIFLQPEFLEIEKQFYLSMSISLAIRLFLEKYIQNVKIKWPNDILVNKNKICGILIENSIKGSSMFYSIIGVGINVNQTEYSNFTPSTTSLKRITNTSFNLNELFTDLCYSLNKYYNLLRYGEFNKIKNEYLNNLFQINEMCYYQDKISKFKAKITGIDKYGNLILLDENMKERRYFFKEITYIY